MKYQLKYNKMCFENHTNWTTQDLNNLKYKISIEKGKSVIMEENTVHIY